MTPGLRNTWILWISFFQTFSAICLTICQCITVWSGGGGGGVRICCLRFWWKKGWHKMGKMVAPFPRLYLNLYPPQLWHYSNGSCFVSTGRGLKKNKVDVLVFTAKLDFIMHFIYHIRISNGMNSRRGWAKITEYFGPILFKLTGLCVFYESY